MKVKYIFSLSIINLILIIPSQPQFFSLSLSFSPFLFPPSLDLFLSLLSSLLLSVLTCWAIFLSVVPIAAAVLSAAATDKAQESSDTEHGQDY